MRVDLHWLKPMSVLKAWFKTMYKPKSACKENPDVVNGNVCVQKKAVESVPMRFNDSRAEVAAQLKLQEIARNSSHPTAAIQLQTKLLSWQDQDYNFGTGSINVGKFMEVGLDPNNMQQGQSANLNTSQDQMMSAIRNQWGITGGELVKGHLWNDNLGGSAMNYNLYPITKAANSDHLGYVENKAKEYVWNHRKPIYYRVEVDANPDINDPKAEFDCEIREWDPNTDALGSLLFGPVTIESDLNDVGAYNEAYETYTGNPADRQKRPKKPKWAKNPKTKVGELTKQELLDRRNQ